MNNRRLWLGVGAIVVLAAGGVGFKLYQWAQQREAQISVLETDFEVELQREEPELGRLPGRIQAVESWESEPRLRRLLCKVYLEASRPQRALDAIQPLAVAMSPAPEDALLGARALMELHATKGGDPLLRQAESLYRAAAANAPEVLFRAWQCGVRLGDDDLIRTLGERLISEWGSSPFARMAKLHAAFDASESIDPDELANVGALLREHPEFAPHGALEWELLDAKVLLERGDLAPALRVVDRILERAPAVVPVRRAAAVGLLKRWYEEGSLEPDTKARLDLHLTWLLEEQDRVLPPREQETYEKERSRLRQT